MPAGVRGVRKGGGGKVLFGQRHVIRTLPELGDVPVLEDSDEPGNQRALPVIAGQDGNGAGGFGNQKVTPKLGDGALLMLFISRVEPDGAGPQGIQQQAIGAPCPGRKEILPGPVIPLQAGRRDEPIERIEVGKKVVPT
jgi:hypothetical protein